MSWAYLSLDYMDAFRTSHPGQGGHFTFWDYFLQAFEHNRGIRIDHFLLSPQLSSRLESCEIDKGHRAAERCPDSAPPSIQLLRSPIRLIRLEITEEFIHSCTCLLSRGLPAPQLYSRSLEIN